MGKFSGPRMATVSLQCGHCESRNAEYLDPGAVGMLTRCWSCRDLARITGISFPPQPGSPELVDVRRLTLVLGEPEPARVAKSS